MEKSGKVGAQIYGYTVCLVAVITFLITLTTLMNAITDLDDPLHAGFTPPTAPSLASFENYKVDILKSLKDGDASKGAYFPDDKALQGMYEAAKNDKIQSVRHNSWQSIKISSLLIVITVLLFGTHWRWMKKVRIEG